MEITTSALAVFAIVSALGIIGVVGVNFILTLQEIDAVPPPTKGCRNSVAVNASQARCFHGER
jgi:hypothetical protein